MSFLEATFLDNNLKYQNAFNNDYIIEQLTIQLSETLNENTVIEYFTRLKSLFQLNKTNFNGWRYGLSLILDRSISEELRQFILHEYVTLFNTISTIDKNRVISELLFLLYHFSLQYSHNFSYKKNSLFKEDYDLSYKNVITDSKWNTNDIEFIISEGNIEEARTLLNVIKDVPTVNDEIAYLIPERTKIKPHILNKIKWYFEKDKYGVVHFSRLSPFIFEGELSSIIRIVNEKIRNEYPQFELLKTFSQEMINKNNFSILHYMISFQKKDFSRPFLKKVIVEPEDISFNSESSFDISKCSDENKFIDSLESTQIISQLFDSKNPDIVIHKLEKTIQKYISIEKENEFLFNEIIQNIQIINNSKHLKQYYLSSKLQLKLTLLYMLKEIQIDHKTFLFCLGNTTKIKKLANLGKNCVIAPKVIKYIKDNLTESIKLKDKFKLHVLFFVISIKSTQQYDNIELHLCINLAKQLNPPFSPGLHRYFQLLLYFGNKIRLTETLYQVFMKFCQSIPDQCIWNENLIEYVNRLLYVQRKKIYDDNEEDIENLEDELKSALSRPNPILDFYYSARLILQHNYLDNSGFIDLFENTNLIIDNYNRTCNINLKFIIIYCLCSDNIELLNYQFVVRNLFRIFSTKMIYNEDLMYNFPRKLHIFLSQFNRYSYDYLLSNNGHEKNTKEKFVVSVDNFIQGRNVCTMLYNNGFINTTIGIYQNNTLEDFYVYSQGKWFNSYQTEVMLENANGIFDIIFFEQTIQRKIVLLFEYNKVSSKDLKYGMLNSFLQEVYNKKVLLSQLLYPLFFFRLILKYPKLIKDFKHLINSYVQLNNTTKCFFISIISEQLMKISPEYFKEILDIVLKTEMTTHNNYQEIVYFLLSDG